MLERIAKTIAAHDLLPGDASVLVAVSGGADSMLLLHSLHGLGKERNWSLTVFHLDHELRGQQGASDAAFVRHAAHALELPFIGVSTCIRQARKTRESMEMAGRRIRREAFANMARKNGISHVATGHTADDRVETLLLNLARGIGIDALESIPYHACLPGGAHLVRPLLDIERKDIEAWLSGKGIDWRNDISNRDPAYRRNRVRHELLPWFEKRLNPRIREALRRLMQQAALYKQWTDPLTDDMTRKCLIEPLATNTAGNENGTLPALAALRLASQPAALRHRVLVRWLQRLGVPPQRIDYATVMRLDRMLTSDSVPATTLPGDIHLHKTSDTLAARREKNDDLAVTDEEWRLPAAFNGSFPIAALRLQVTVHTSTDPVDKTGGKTPALFPATASIRMPRPGEDHPVLRRRRPGDRIRPTGCRGTRKIKDVFIDAKVPPAQRDRIPLLVSGDTVIWLPGYRINEDWRVTDPDSPHLAIRIDPDTDTDKNQEQANCRKGMPARDSLITGS